MRSPELKLSEIINACRAAETAKSGMVEVIGVPLSETESSSHVFACM